MNKTSIITIKGVSKSYDNGLIQALTDINLSLEKGKIYALMGPSGCGKSTLLNIIGTLDTIDSGSILYDNISLDKVGSLDKFRKYFLGFIFQFHHLISVLTLKENIELALFLDKTITLSQCEEKALALLKEMGLEHRMNSYVSEISGGERQRGAIARALANSPALLLADEPTGSVDSKNTKRILDILKEYVKLKQRTILIATHDPYVAAIADVCIMMEDGKIVSINEEKINNERLF